MKLTQKKILSVFMLLLFSGSILGMALDVIFKPNNTNDVTDTVILETSKGTIEIKLNSEKAPSTVANFENYVKIGFYDGLCFHRVMKDFVIQAGGFYANGTIKFPGNPIQIESSNGLKNLKGTIAMARGSDPNSATSQFYINIVDNPSLDYPSFDGYGYTVFGTVISGLDVVETIAEIPTGNMETQAGVMSDWPSEPVVIIRAYMKEG